MQLFRTNYYPDPITSISQFYVIDFNGEYTGIGMFGIDENDKVIYEIATNKENSDKIPIKKEYLFNADILAILFDARPATQVPFLRRSINIWNEKNFDGNGIAKFVVGTIKKILTSGDAASSDAKDNWITVANSFISNDSLFDELKSLEYHSQRKAYMYMRDGQTQYINDKSDMSLEDLNI